MTTEELNARNQEDQSFNFEELFFMMLGKWYWFLLALIICLSAAVFKILSTTPTYTRSAMLLIKDENDGTTTSTNQEFADLGLIAGKSNIINEQTVISAPVLMEEVAQRLHLDVEMTVRQRLYDHPLYNDAPVSITLGTDIDPQDAFSFTLKLAPNKKVRLEDITVAGVETGKEINATLGQAIRAPFGTITLTPTTEYGEQWFNEDISVTKSPVKAIGGMYAGRLGVSITDKQSSILQLTVQDEVPARASDVILTLIDVYNESWLRDKNRMAESTSDFINERLNTLAQELGDVDRDIADYKSQNLLPDVTAASGMIMNRSQQNYSTILQSYNQTTLRRNELLANSSETSPIIQAMDEQLREQRTAILRSLGNVIAQLKAQLANLERSEGETNEKIAANPRQARQLLGVERQQKVKESLYIYLLQKREENELSKAYTAWNTRIIQPPIGSSAPAAPNKKMILLIGLLLGLAIPAAIIYLREILNKTVRGRKDLEGMQAPLLGEIPTMDRKKHFWERKKAAARKIVIQPNKRDMINESFRLVRTTALLNQRQYDTVIHECGLLIAADSTLVDAWYNLGMAYFSQAVNIGKSPKVTVKQKQQMTKKYQSARHYLEHFRQLAPDQRNRWALPLYTIYLNLNMGDKFDEIDRVIRSS